MPPTAVNWLRRERTTTTCPGMRSRLRWGSSEPTRAWIAAITDGTRAEPDFDDGAAVQRIITACARKRN